jgi:hypothetical protein
MEVNAIHGHSSHYLGECSFSKIGTLLKESARPNFLWMATPKWSAVSLKTLVGHYRELQEECELKT